MSNRIIVKEKHIDEALKILKDQILRRMRQHGSESFSSKHEVLGIITEEYWELIEAVKSDDEDRFLEELEDIAVPCVFWIASKNQNGESRKFN